MKRDIKNNRKNIIKKYMSKNIKMINIKNHPMSMIGTKIC